ncbi:MAG: hypothetical protein Phyf2KO_22190 [Phycisphaerales bacterium]
MSEEAQLKSLMVTVVVLLVSFGFSCSELKYVMRGEVAQAQMMSMKEVQSSGRRGRKRPMLEVQYSFKDSKDGSNRTEVDRVPVDFEPRVGETEGGRPYIEVENRPGELARSRLAGHDNMTMVYVFFGTLILSVGGTCWACYQYFKD